MHTTQTHAHTHTHTRMYNEGDAVPVSIDFHYLVLFPPPQGTQMVLLSHTKDVLQHLRHCKAEIIASRRATDLTIGWEVPQNSIRLACSQGTGVYGEVFSGTMDGTEVTVKLLQHMTVKRLRDQFCGEIEILR